MAMREVPEKKKEKKEDDVLIINTDGKLTKELSECVNCLYSEVCPKAFASLSCSIVTNRPFKMDTLEDLVNLQKDMLSDSLTTLSRVEALARMGVVDFSDLDRVRRQVLDFTERLKKSMFGRTSKPSSASSKLGIHNG
jgi:hypothetical protein